MLGKIRAIPLFLVYMLNRAEDFNSDVRRLSELNDVNLNSRADLYFYIFRSLASMEEVRSIFYLRYPRAARVLKLFFGGIPAFYFSCPSVGPGLVIQHGFATIVVARSIGRNFWINQQVTIGHDKQNDYPTIGNNVSIRAGAKVFGNIIIGDNVVIGANAVVNKSVPPDCTIVGVVAHIVKRNGVRVDEKL